MHKAFLGFSLTVLIFLLFSNCQPQTQKISKINGLSFVASRDTIQQKHINPILDIHANWVSIMPFAFMRKADSTQLFYNNERQWYGERVTGVKQYIKLMHSNGIKVMLKPQIWIGGGDFTGYISMKTESDWKTFEQNYLDMLMLYAKVAEESNVEMFCIGTELNNFVSERPQFWTSLISSVKNVYSGELTYAENWDKIENVPFWSELDYIGVDAYFPISKEKTPSLDSVKMAWQPISQNLKTLSEKHDKPILFTEYGYRSIDFAGKEPWHSIRIDGQTNEVTQDVLLKGLMDSVWDQPWFAGGFLWKWFHNHDQASERHANRFSIRHKHAEQSIKKYYAKFE
ncbi:glycoside hydrolase [Flavobacterium sp. CS20]|uniref:glycoside hydrolase family 113 n=1 Tax=Flavobacterium sp. CS20 TaxID=2775246 RepID=UPI001B3A6AF6|nr:glycoside hydrolase [Flavobacterium sp. CS20]QTY26589.1 glycoside hydrolase [Flavobacterium sp. CS20]